MEATFTDKFQVTVNDYVTGITLSSLPTKTAYKYGEDIDLSGGKFLKIMHSGNAATEENLTSSMITGYDSETFGEQTITVKYTDSDGEYETIFKVTVSNYITGIEISTNPSKTNYIHGDTIDITGMKVDAIKANGEKIEITEDVTINKPTADYDLQEVTVEYKTTNTIDDAEKTFTDNFEITVIKKLETLLVTEEAGNKYVNEPVIVGKIKEGANERPVTIGEIKYYVTIDGIEIQTGEIVTSKYRREMDMTAPVETQEDIVIVLNANQTGNYEITPYVGDTYNAEAVQGAALELEVIDNPEVSSIEIIGLAENELRADNQIALDKEIIFKNEREVTIPVEARSIGVTAPSGVTVTLLNAEDTAIDAISRPSEEVKKIRLATTIEEARAITITFSIDGKTLTQNISIGEVSKITGIEVANTVTLYETKPADDNSGMIIEEGEEVYTLLEISLTSNYGKVPLKANQIVMASEGEGLLSYTDSASADVGYSVATIQGYKKDGDNIVSATGEDEIEYIGITAYPMDNLDGETITLTYTINGAKVTKIIDMKVDLKQLSTLIVTEEVEARYVDEPVIVGKIKEGANERPVTIGEIKYHVTLDGIEIQTGEIVTTKTRREMDITAPVETQEDIVIVLNANQAGNYEITPYVGDTYNAEAIKGATLEVEVIDNPEVSFIEILGLAENELRADNQMALDKEIIFKNERGVTIPVEARNIEVTAPSGVTVVLLNAEDTEIDAVSRPSEEVKKIRLSTTIEEARAITITFSIDGKTLTQNISIGGIAKITGIEVANTVTLYETMPVDDNSGMIIDEDGEICTLLEISLTSNYGKVPLKANQIRMSIEGEGLLSYTDSASVGMDYTTTTIYGYKKVGDNIVLATEEDEIQYIGITAYPPDIDYLAGETITLTYISNGERVTETITIVPE